MKTTFKSCLLNAYNIIFNSGTYLFLILTVVGCSGNDSDNGNPSNNLTPVDIIIIIDNSGDMTSEIQGIQNNLNASFAQVLESEEVDFRIVLIGKYGMLNSESVCIEAPLSGIVNCINPPSEPINSAKYFHYSVEIGSNDSLCKILETLNLPDEYNLAPNGWIDLLRINSFKFFLEFTTDGVDCFSGESFNDFNTLEGGTTVSEAFNAALTSLSPSHFGTAVNPNFKFISVIANPDKDSNNPALAYTASDPITISECPTAVSPGTGYQGLSILTNASRFSVCEPNSYDSIFNVIAQAVINAASQ